MKRKILLLIVITVFALLGCRERGIKGSGEVVSEVREVEDFSEIEVSGTYNINISVGGTTEVNIDAEDNLQKFITAEVVSDRLIIENTRNILPKRKINIDITVPDLEYINSSGVSNIYASGIDEQTFEVELSGAGVIELFGKVEQFNADLSGAALLEARELFARFIDINIAGAANAEVYVSEKLVVDISGNGNLEYYGDPLEVESNISGIGQVTKREF